MLAPWRGQLEQVWGPKIDPKVGKTSQNQPKMKFSEKVKNRAFCVKTANFSLSEDPDTHFMAKIAIFSGLG